MGQEPLTGHGLPLITRGTQGRLDDEFFCTAAGDQFSANPAGLLGGSGYQNFGGLSSGFSNLGSGVSGFANRGILPFSVASVVSGFANIGTNLAGFFQGTTS